MVPATPHLLPPTHNQSSFPSPSSPASSLSEQHYPPFYHHQHQSAQPQMGDSIVDRVVDKSSALSLNLSSLSVASPTNLSPINPSPHPSTHASSHVSPITPISPSNAGLHHPGLSHHHHHHSHSHHPHIQHPFQFTPPDQGVRYDDGHYDYNGGRRLTSSRSSSSSEKSVPRKRSYTTLTPLATSVEEPAYDLQDHPNSSMYDEVDMAYGGLDPEGSPVDGSNSGGEQEDQLKPMEGQIPTSGGGVHSGMGPSSLSILGKPLGTNNFVTKLYQMINDPKSAQFITWTDLGTSFVVSNVGEFSRTILGSHFKHNNFSSFVRQLNMYGFHKINRTPRAQRTSADVQTWEFSHHKFLRGRPDLLEEIKRKALEPDPSMKHRVELPGEVAAQLAQMREDNRRLMAALHAEKSKVARLANVTKVMYDVMAKAFPGGVPLAFPADILDAAESPNIYVTSPTNTAHFPPPLSSISTSSLHSLHSLSPGSSPTAADFPAHAHSLSRQHSFQHVSGAYDGAFAHGVSTARYETALATPLPPSPGPIDFDDGRVGTKRQRTAAPPPATSAGSGEQGVSKRASRARSDSAPLGYGLNSGWPQTRPRSGSGLGPRAGRRDELPVPNIGSLSRGHTLPMLSIPSMTKQSPS
ncbi:Heat shock factor protein [Grifola frondosa]|uniref:Heat shock factor protein n=1 Tax=Grifola frondosa TaxID=5627 RepID=A0A1C7MAA9_GRIFR|nr:Heat shock factor protein [Grifola frondosa]